MKKVQKFFIVVGALMIAAPALADDGYHPYYEIENPPPKGTRIVVHSPIQRATKATTDTLVGAQKGVTDATGTVVEGITSFQHDTVIPPVAPYPPHAVAEDVSE